MGLADRKVKQKIQADPRNLTWKNDASRFGHAYLSKLGWSTGSSLGLTGQGLTEYIRVAHKLDALGIGARVGGKEDRDGRAGREFDGLLRRLNASAEEGEDVTMEENIKISGFHKASGEEGLTVEGTVVVEEHKKGKKRKREVTEEGESPNSSSPEETTTATTTVTITQTTTPASAVPRRLAHRSRFLRAKSLAKSDSRAMSEILGIASAPASLPGTPRDSSPVPAAFPTLSSGPATPSEPQEPEVTPKDDELVKTSTSSFSVADYFKQKMRAKLGLAPSTSEPSSAPQTPMGSMQEEDGSMKMGMGFGKGLGLEAGNGLGFRSASSGTESDEQRDEQGHLDAKETEAQDIAEHVGEKKRKKAKKEKKQSAEVPVPEEGKKKKKRKSEAIEPVEVTIPMKDGAPAAGERQKKKKRKNDLNEHKNDASLAPVDPPEPEHKKKKSKSDVAAEPSSVPPIPETELMPAKNKKEKRKKLIPVHPEPVGGEKRKKKRKTGEA
ncbi:hypothetical protein DACRYDRAFT_19133 [Dacryopinax primogenitus]|uniref:G-patch domain-containing protein n=1 Tax=Dacryopinax primogenitus (strain DJM 731) TaxID=1858805 RepID=M5FTX3_DACPD|nr:uncharacterized protein DACRYDRAFT_19133 [Dacryopinax primogenitus]EJT96661.1 hypothetical protein DACRYDRAFT_19133 [Dacryopinax primogenitus]